MDRRFFVDRPIAEGTAQLTGPEAEHLTKVLRGKAGDAVTLFDGSGAEFTARITRTGRSVVELAVLSSPRDLPRVDDQPHAGRRAAQRGPAAVADRESRRVGRDVPRSPDHRARCRGAQSGRPCPPEPVRDRSFEAMRPEPTARNRGPAAVRPVLPSSGPRGMPPAGGFRTRRHSFGPIALVRCHPRRVAWRWGRRVVSPTKNSRRRRRGDASAWAPVCCEWKPPP